MRIDAHQHFWRIERGDYGWLTPELGAIHRDFGPGDLAPLLADHDIARTILVQAAPTEAETRWLLDLAARTPFVAGVVGWCDLEAPDAPERIAALAADRLLVGLRPMVQDHPDPGWLARPILEPALRAVEAHGLVFDALIKPPQIAATLAMIDRHPGLVVVVDHGAKPDLAGGELSDWKAGIAALAERPNTVCKLSGLVTEAASGWTVEMLRPAVDHLLRCFGPNRLLWGSDWPVAALRASYPCWLEAAEALLADLGPADREAVFGGNARRIYLSRRGR